MLLIALLPPAHACFCTRSGWDGSVPRDGEEDVPVDVTPTHYYQQQSIRTDTDHLYLLNIDTGAPVTFTSDWFEFGTGARLRMVPAEALAPLSEYEVGVGVSDEDGVQTFRFRTGEGESPPPSDSVELQWGGEGVDDPGSCGGSYFVDVTALAPVRQWEVRVDVPGAERDVMAALDGAARIGADRCWESGSSLIDADSFRASAREVGFDGAEGEWGPWVSFTTPSTCGCGGGLGGREAAPFALALVASRRRRRPTHR